MTTLWNNIHAAARTHRFFFGNEFFTSDFNRQNIRAVIRYGVLSRLIRA